MGKSKVKVTFETITPIWTGDAWGQNTEIKPSSIMGSLRFWFEVYCHFAGIEVKEKEELKEKDYKKIVKDVKDKIEKDNPINIENEIFNTLPLTLSSKLFGCTGWKSRIEIESIKYLNNYCFGNKLNLPNKILNNKRWFFTNPYFFGKFEIVFKVDSNMLNDFLLLLSFMNDYGYLGGKNNIGYGRIKVNKLIIDGEAILIKFNENILRKSNLNLNTQAFNIIKEILGVKRFFCQSERDFDNKIENLPQKVILLTTENTQNENYQQLIKKLIEKKIELRNCLRAKKEFNGNVQNKWKNFRHYIFGTTSGESNATKIIPYFNAKKDNSQWKISEYGFLSIVGIKTFGENNE